MTEKIYPGGGAVECAKKTPLVDLLRSLDRNERGVIESEFETRFMPIGAMCHDAADEIDRLRKIEAAAKMALEMLDLCNKNGWMLADYEGQMYAALTALRTALGEKE